MTIISKGSEDSRRPIHKNIQPLGYSVVREALASEI
jgi:hypothetical protein